MDTGTGDITISNISAYSNQDALMVSNSGSISVTKQGSGYTSCNGIDASSFNSPVSVTNTGTITATAASGNICDGISASSNALIAIDNSGSVTGTNAGIYTENAATVNNSGLASGGTYSIFVQSGSTVNLNGASPVQGRLKGGADDTSTSQLNFNIAIRGKYLAADEAALNAAIAQYDAAYATANGNGANVDSEVVVLNGVDYQWEDFAGVADNLVQARLYANIPGYQSLGLVLDNLPNNAASNILINALNNVPDAGVANALAELSPKELEVLRNVAFDNNSFNVAQINNHLANRRDGLNGYDATALDVQDSTMDPTLNQVRDHLLAYDPVASPGLINDSVDSLFGGMDMKSAPVNTMPTDRWSSFIAGDVVLADLSHNANLQDSNYTTGNVTAGADYRLDDHFTVGALFAYAHTDADLDSHGSSGTVDSYSPGIYASYVDGPWYANFLGAYSRNAYTSDRMVDIAGLGGDNHGGTNGNQGTVNLTGGYEFQQGAFKFGPVASVQYVQLAIDSMQEHGPTALAIDSQDEDSLRSQVGVEGRYSTVCHTCYGTMSLTPHVSLSWQHEYLDDSRGINAQFTGSGGGSFTTQTDSPDRDAAFIDVGLDANVEKNVSVFADYETQAGQRDYFAQSAEGGVKIGF